MLSFLSYFFKYIFSSNNRQKLLIISSAGLFLSAFSLLTIQAIMGGLQSNLVNRSKFYKGHATLFFKEKQETTNIIQFLQSHDISYYKELTAEMLVRKDNIVKPVIVHGIDFSNHFPEFLKNKDTKGAILGSSLSSYLNAYMGSELVFISPSHTDYILGDIPRQISTMLSDFNMSEIQDVDRYHAWVRLSLLQNLMRTRGVNRIVITQKMRTDVIEMLKKNFSNVELLTWEQQNNTLAWALKLETTVMIILFISMTLLVSISISSGLLLFFDKIKIDLMSFWILGKSTSSILKMIATFCLLFSTTFISLGLMSSRFFLMVLENKNFFTFPDYFLEQNIPVQLSLEYVVVSFSIPFFISFLFSFLTFRTFKSESQDFIQLIRKV